MHWARREERLKCRRKPASHCLQYSGPEPTDIFAEWEKPALEASWLNEIVTALELVRTRCGVSAEDVRFVYGFDS